VVSQCKLVSGWGLSAKLHYTDMLYNTTNGHHRRTRSQQVVDVVQHVRSRLNLLYNILPRYGHVVQHHQRTSSQQFYNLLYNKFTANGQKFATSQHLDMSRCWAVALRCGKFVVGLQQVVELLWPYRWYNMSVAGVRVVEFGTNETEISAEAAHGPCGSAKTVLFMH